jgi:hypothetical protein
MECPHESKIEIHGVDMGDALLPKSTELVIVGAEFLDGFCQGGKPGKERIDLGAKVQILRGHSSQRTSADPETFSMSIGRWH